MLYVERYIRKRQENKEYIKDMDVLNENKKDRMKQRKHETRKKTQEILTYFMKKEIKIKNGMNFGWGIARGCVRGKGNQRELIYKNQKR